MKKIIIILLAIIVTKTALHGQIFTGVEYAELTANDRHYKADFRVELTKDSFFVHLLSPRIEVTQYNEFTGRTDTVWLTDEPVGIILAVKRRNIRTIGKAPREEAFIWVDKKTKKTFLFICNRQEK